MSLVDIALKITGVEKNTLGKLAVTVNLEAIFIRVLKERSVNDGGDFCLLWLVIPKSA